MALTSKKKLMLEKQYLYVKASMGFQLEGMNVEKVWVNTGYYRFLVDNVAKALSNSYINIWYDPNDIDFIAYCSDLFMEEIQNTVVTAVENLETYLQQFAQQNHEDITDLSTGLSGALQLLLSKGALFDFSLVNPVYNSITTYSAPTLVNVSSLEVGEKRSVVVRSFVNANTPSLYSGQSFDGFYSSLKLTNRVTGATYLIVDNFGDVHYVNGNDASSYSWNMPMSYIANVWRVS